jgi:uncharacterized coiled-coil protein SlyX
VSEHAPLGPSSAERWIACPASIRFGAKFDTGESSPWAEEGTTAHELAALKVRAAFGEDIVQELAAWVAAHQELSAEDVADMHRFTDEYVAFVQRQASTMRHPQVAVEVRVDTGVPECWGTADAVLFSPWEIKVVDFKYGTGVAVEAAGNPQLKLYTLGVLNAYQGLLGDYDEIVMSIFQPRLGIAKSVTMPVMELERWRDDVVKPAAELALSDGAPFGPSYDTCRFCPAAGRCEAQLRAVFDTEFNDDPDEMSPAQIADALDAAPLIRAWLGQLEEAALRMAYSEGTPIPGWKVVRSGGKRFIPEPAPAIQTFIDHGYPASEVAKISMIGLGDLEALIKKKEGITGRAATARLNELLGDLIAKSEGKESLVPEDDKRPAINPETEAQKVFTPEVDE